MEGQGKSRRNRARAALRAAADGSITLTAEQVTTLTNIDYLADQLDEEIDTLLDDLGIADPDEEDEPEEPADPNTNSLRAKIRMADRRGDRETRGRLQAAYRALPLVARRELITAERVDERTGRRVVSIGRRPTAAVARSASVPAAADAKPTLYGEFAVFDTWTEIESFWEGEFMESIAPGAFANTIANDQANMRVTLNHGRDALLGNKVLGRIDVLKENDRGAYYEVALYRGIPELVMEGLRDDAYGASFRFYVMAENMVEKPKPSAYNPRGIPERTITEAKVEEFGPVTFPQYPEASAHLRSLIPERIKSAAAEPQRRQFKSREEFLRWIS